MRKNKFYKFFESFIKFIIFILVSAGLGFAIVYPFWKWSSKSPKSYTICFLIALIIFIIYKIVKKIIKHENK